MPRKNLRPLAGLPLIAHTIRCAQACPVFQRIVVSTDDREIMEVAKQYGAEAPFLRPAHLAQDDTSKWLVFRHLVQTLEQITGHSVDVLVDLDTGVPLRQPSDIVGCVEQLLSGSAEVVATAYEAERNPYFNMVEVEANGFAKIVKPPAKPIAYRQGHHRSIVCHPRPMPCVALRCGSTSTGQRQSSRFMLCRGNALLI